MSTLEDLDDLERDQREEKEKKAKQDGDDKKDGDNKKSGDDTEMKDAEEEDDVLDEEILSMSTRDIVARRRLLENELRIMKSEINRLTHEKATMNEKIKDNVDKIENNRFVASSVRFRTSVLTASDNCRTWSETSSKYWTLTLKQKPPKKVQI